MYVHVYVLPPIFYWFDVSPRRFISSITGDDVNLCLCVCVRVPVRCVNL